MLARADVDLVVVAIKLFEAGIHERCSVSGSHRQRQPLRRDRLMSTCGLTEADAWLRIRSQSPQEEKNSRSDYVISTDGSFQDTYTQTQVGLERLRSEPGGPAHLSRR